jgi:hypothetical protein
VAVFQVCNTTRKAAMTAVFRRINTLHTSPNFELGSFTCHSLTYGTDFLPVGQENTECSLRFINWLYLESKFSLHPQKPLL